MSKVYSFRLDADNPREAQAMDVIDTWISQGYSLRHILTNALIQFKSNGVVEREWDSVYEQLAELVQEMKNGVSIRSASKDQHSLPHRFVGAIKKTAKGGLYSE